MREASPGRHSSSQVKPESSAVPDVAFLRKVRPHQDEWEAPISPVYRQMPAGVPQTARLRHMFCRWPECQIQMHSSRSPVTDRLARKPRLGAPFFSRASSNSPIAHPRSARCATDSSGLNRHPVYGGCITDKPQQKAFTYKRQL